VKKSANFAKTEKEKPFAGENMRPLRPSFSLA